MIYGSIRVHVGPYGPIWVARGEKRNVKKVKIFIRDSDFFQGLCPRDLETVLFFLHWIRSLSVVGGWVWIQNCKTVFAYN